MSEETLVRIRKRIDEIDGELLQLLAERVKLAGETARLKKKLGKELRDERREREVLRRARIEGGRLGLDPNFVETFMRVVISGGLGEETKELGG